MEIIHRSEFTTTVWAEKVNFAIEKLRKEKKEEHLMTF